MKKGFTLIELLVVIAIIALLSTLSVVALNSARVKSRDARRLSDIKQLHTALEMYFDQNQSYPTTTGALGSGNFACLNSAGWAAVNCSGTVYMQKVPTDPKNSTPFVYTYTPQGSGATSYTIAYALEGPSTTATATPDTIGYNQ
ncbi:MAG TPA: prepilin-type N-terminal cleavage/methylation domain-containing protein [bacterium]|nr:prepilin-type N-terminal cleavage/methylation domain-containing protein [bacterium]